MTVGELIKLLEKWPQDLTILVPAWHRYEDENYTEKFEVGTPYNDKYLTLG